MSVINKMLQELDRRNADPAESPLPAGVVRPVEPVRAGHEWFWRIVSVLLLGGAGWTAWVAYQLQPRPLATEAAIQAGAKGSKPAEPVATPAASPAPAPVVALAPPTPEPSPPKAEAMAEKPAVAEAPRAVAKAATPARGAEAVAVATPRATRSAAPALRDLDVPPARILSSPPSRAARVEKRDLHRSPAERAEAEFRRAVGLMNQTRISEAEDGFLAALTHDAAHESARQALVSLMFERNRFEDGRRLLQEGLAINPSSAPFSIALARLFAERREYANALEALKAAQASGAGRADYHALAGTIHQRMGRHKEAVDDYSSALRIAPGSGAAWVGLGISLEALERRADAAECFRRAVATGSLSAEVRDFAEQRARSLQ